MHLCTIITAPGGFAAYNCSGDVEMSVALTVGGCIGLVACADALANTLFLKRTPRMARAASAALQASGRLAQRPLGTAFAAMFRYQRLRYHDFTTLLGR